MGIVRLTMMMKTRSGPAAAVRKTGGGGVQPGLTSSKDVEPYPNSGVCAIDVYRTGRVRKDSAGGYEDEARGFQRARAEGGKRGRTDCVAAGPRGAAKCRSFDAAGLRDGQPRRVRREADVRGRRRRGG